MAILFAEMYFGSRQNRSNMSFTGTFTCVPWEQLSFFKLISNITSSIVLLCKGWFVV